MSSFEIVTKAVKVAKEPKEIRISTLSGAAKWLRFGKIAKDGKPLVGFDAVYAHLSSMDKPGQEKAIAYANQIMNDWALEQALKSKNEKRGWGKK